MSGINQLIATQAERNPIVSNRELAAQDQMSAMRDQKIKANKFKIDDMERDKNINGLKFFANVKSQLEKIEDPEKRSQIYATAREFAQRNGHPVDQIPEAYDESAQNILDVAHMQVFNPDRFEREMNKKGFQFGGQIEMKDEAGNIFLGTMVKDPNSGIVDSRLVPVSGAEKPQGRLTMVSASGMTPDEKVGQMRQIESAKQGVKMQTEPMIQGEIVRSKMGVQNELEKEKSNNTNLQKLSIADEIYKSLSDSDLGKIYGKYEQFYPEWARSQEGVDMIKRRDQLMGMLALGARGELKGQGQITDQEQQILNKSLATLESPNISPELARKALDEAMSTLYGNAGRDFESDYKFRSADKKSKDENPPKYKKGQIIEHRGKQYRVLADDFSGNPEMIELVQ